MVFESSSFSFDVAEAPQSKSGSSSREVDKKALEKMQSDTEEPPTSLVNQAAEQNKDLVIRNVEAILTENFKNYDKRGAIGELLRLEYPPEADGLHKFFRDDMQYNLILNVSQILARGNAMADVAEGKSPKPDGVFGILDKFPQPKEFWHSSNEQIDVTKYVGNAFRAIQQDPESMSRALKALETQINFNLHDANIGKPLADSERDGMRQLAENAAMIKLAFAESRFLSNPEAAKDLVSGKSASVDRLIRIATEYGADKENVAQLKRISEEIAGR